MNTQHTTEIDTQTMKETFLEYINGDLTISEMANKYGINTDYLEALIKYGGSQFEAEQMTKVNTLIWEKISLLQLAKH
jgi:predicted DNA-binding protein YlxM (UPF0122 family)